MELTSDTSKFAALLYKLYLDKLNLGIPKQEAVIFKDKFYIGVKDFSDWSSYDIDFSIQELLKTKLISANILGDIKIEPEFIIQMEKRFKKNIDSVIKFLKDLALGLVENLIFQ